MNKLRRKWRSLFRRKNRPSRAAAAKHVNGHSSAAAGNVSRTTERTATGARQRAAIGGNQRAEARRNQRVEARRQRAEAQRNQRVEAQRNQRAEARRNQRTPVGGNRRAERGSNKRDPAQLAKRATNIGKFLYLDPQTMLKIPEADNKN